MERKNYFEMVGGYRVIELMVADFYQSALKDDRINQFYIENVSDIAGLHTTLTQFLCFIFGGPNVYTGRNLV